MYLAGMGMHGYRACSAVEGSLLGCVGHLQSESIGRGYSLLGCVGHLQSETIAIGFAPARRICHMET